MNFANRDHDGNRALCVAKDILGKERGLHPLACPQFLQGPPMNWEPTPNCILVGTFCALSIEILIAFKNTLYAALLKDIAPFFTLSCIFHVISWENFKVPRASRIGENLLVKTSPILTHSCLGEPLGDPWGNPWIGPCSLSESTLLSPGVLRGTQTYVLGPWPDNTSHCKALVLFLF